MNIFRVLSFEIRVKVIHTDIPKLFEEWSNSGIKIQQAKMLDLLTAEFTISSKCFSDMQRIADQRQAEIEIIDGNGISGLLNNLRERMSLLIGVLIILFLSVFLPSRIWFISVEGNHQLPDQKILEYAEKAGIYFGVPRHSVRSEYIKNRLMEQLPELKWAGVNTAGAVARISVAEKNADLNQNEFQSQEAIVAARDGVVYSITVTGGNALCHIGQAVKVGDVLISSYRDYGLLIRKEKPNGEIFAKTLRELEIVIPVNKTVKGDLTGSKKRFSLQIGKKRIKLYNDSRIYGTSCDKMYKEYCITLPGGFRLPIRVIMESYQFRDSCVVSVVGKDMSFSGKTFAEDYLYRQMIAGKILSDQLQIVNEDNICRIYGRYQCLEMIGRVQNEEILPSYGEND